MGIRITADVPSVRFMVPRAAVKENVRATEPSVVFAVVAVTMTAKRKTPVLKPASAKARQRWLESHQEKKPIPLVKAKRVVMDTPAVPKP